MSSAPSTAPTYKERLVEQYTRGVDAGYPKMVARVGQGEADKWRVNSIAAAHRQAEHYVAMSGRDAAVSYPATTST